VQQIVAEVGAARSIGTEAGGVVVGVAGFGATLGAGAEFVSERRVVEVETEVSDVGLGANIAWLGGKMALKDIGGGAISVYAGAGCSVLKTFSCSAIASCCLVKMFLFQVWRFCSRARMALRRTKNTIAEISAITRAATTRPVTTGGTPWLECMPEDGTAAPEEDG